MLVATIFIACNDPYADQFVADPTINEQKPLLPNEGFEFKLGSQMESPIVLTSDDLDNGMKFELVKTTSHKLTEEQYIKFKVEASHSKDFTKVIDLPTVSENNSANVLATDINEAVKTLYGKAPNARELFFRVRSFLVDNDVTLQISSETILGPVTVTPVGQVIETEYYLVGNINGWNIEDLEDIKFSHSGKDVYEDPFFSILVNNLINEDGDGYFKIVPKSSKETASWDGLLGNPIDGNTALEGELVIGGDAMRVTEPGWVKINLNMLDYTYTIELIGEMNLSLYVPGGYQDWSPATAPSIYSRNMNFKYEGYVYFNNATEFKFTSQPDWNGIGYGDGGSDGVLSDDGGAGNLKVEEAGYYKLNVDLSANPFTYSAVKTTWGIIGDATPGGWDNSTDMTYDDETKQWSIVVELSDKEFKFRANNGWDINIGGALDNLTDGGDNIKIEESGTYLVTLDLSDPTVYTATLTKQ